MLVSICIPVYNSERYLKDTLESILNQSYEPIEIILSDNASTDNSWELILELKKKDSRIKIFRNPENIGYAANCNKMIQSSSGELIAIYHADDIYHKDIVKESVDVLRKKKELSGIFTLYERIDEYNNALYDTIYPIRKKGELTLVSLEEFIDCVLIKGGSPFCCPTSVIRREVYQKINGYNENLKYIDDQDMWARILLRGCLAIINKPLISYRIHNNQTSSIYKKKTKSESLPLKHIVSFIYSNNLQNFEAKVNYAKSKQAIVRSYHYAIEGSYKKFLVENRNSKLSFRHPIDSTLGCLQIMNPRLLYFTFKIISRLRSSKHY